MDVDASLRFNQIEQFPLLQLEHDDIHSNCSICIGAFIKDEIILILPCIHKFHRCCIQPWLSKNNTCPTCRERVIHNVDEVSDGDGDDGEQDFSDSSDSASEIPSHVSWNIVVNNFTSFFDPNVSSSTDTSDMSFERNSDSSDSSGSSVDTSIPDSNEFMSVLSVLQQTNESHSYMSDVSINFNSSGVSINANSSHVSINSSYTSIHSNASVHSNSTVNDISLASWESHSENSNVSFDTIDQSDHPTDTSSDGYSD